MGCNVDLSVCVKTGLLLMVRMIASIMFISDLAWQSGQYFGCRLQTEIRRDRQIER